MDDTLELTIEQEAACRAAFDRMIQQESFAQPDQASVRAEEKKAEEKLAEELAMMIRVLVSSLKRHWPYATQPGDLPSRAIDLLRKHDLLGSPLRTDDQRKCVDR